jgi:hypothetical protein
VISDLNNKLAEIESEIEKAALSPVVTISATLSRAVPLLEAACSSLRTCAPDARPAAAARLQLFRSKLSTFHQAMRRSEAIFQGYLHHADVTQSQYSPAGAFAVSREPALFNLSV